MIDQFVFRLWWLISQLTTLLCTHVVCAISILSERLLCARLRILHNYYLINIYIYITNSWCNSHEYPIMLDYCTYCIFCTTRTIKTESTISIYLYLQSIPVRTILCYIPTNNTVVYSIFVFLCFGLCILLLLFFLFGF